MSEFAVDPLSVLTGSGANAGQDLGPASNSLVELVDLTVQPTLEVALGAVREMLGMEVAYISQCVGDRLVVGDVEGDGESFSLSTGRSFAREDTFCQRMLDGRIPNLTPDVRGDDRTASLAITRESNVGAYATVPLTFGDGHLYGTLCAASHDARSLGYRQLGVLKVFARLIAGQLERQETVEEVSHLAALVNASGDAIMGLTLAGVVMSWNAASERIFGYRTDEAIGQNIVDLIAVPGHEDGMRQSLVRVASGEVVRRVGRRQRADGMLIYDDVTLSPIRDQHGVVSLISAVARDVSDAVIQAHYRAVEKDVLSSLHGATDAAEAALGALRALGHGSECELVALWELDETGQRLRCSSLWTSEPAADALLTQTMRSDCFERGQQLPGGVWATGEPVWIERLDRVGDDERAAHAAAAGLRTAVGFPLWTGAEVVGVIEFISANDAAQNPELLALGGALVGRIADALARHRAQEALRSANQVLELRVLERTIELEGTVAGLEAAQIETVCRLSHAVEFRDHVTGTHIARVSIFAARMARRVGLDDDRCTLIQRATPLHDVGKVGIPDSVLLKPGPLTPAERAVIETHAAIGHRLLDGSDSPVLQLAASIALTHHEHYDGSGYPRGLAGEHIPIEGRIVAIADVFDALTSDRAYRPAMAFTQALDILQAGRGAHFDPELLDHFLEELHQAGTDVDPSIAPCAAPATQSNGARSGGS